MNRSESLMYETGKRVANSDDETIFALIIDIAKKADNNMALAILRIGDREHWTVQRTALALAYTFMVKDDGHLKELSEAVARSTRPMIINTHCTSCNCADKRFSIEDK